MSSPRRTIIPKMVFRHDDDDKDDEEDEDEADSIEWMNIIFLPYHPVFRLTVLLVVIIKLLVSSIEALYPIIYCSHVMDTYLFFTITSYIYVYLCDIIYATDTFLHIVHRLANVAKRREYLPKSKTCIMLDVVSLIPFYRLLTSDSCTPMQFWPNVLNMIDFITIYRIEEYFSLATTHSFWNLVIGYTLMLIVTTNFLACLFILVTHKIQKDFQFHDWRQHLIQEINVTSVEQASYIDAVLLVSSYALHHLCGDSKPSCVTEYYIVALLMIASFVVMTFFAYPKSFAESLLTLRRSFEFFPRVQKIVSETQRRSHSIGAPTDVSNFYQVMWEKRDGITTTPEIIIEFPRHLRLDIKMDLSWPIFYHSPTLRRVSVPFIHFLCDFTHLDFKLPHENFFASPQCRSHIFYLKSGIVQLLSTEDGKTPLLSMTSGTLFGDINFFLPPSGSKTAIVRCLTYCEVYFFTRVDILKALHKFPDDRKKVMGRIKDKIKHAKTLYTCKQHVRGLDRSEDEGIAWIKRRWWELYEAYSNWKKATTKTETPFEFPPEEAVYHCSKYIGQLVLCPDEQLKRHSMFASCQFPWIITPDSNFIRIWQYLVKCTVALVLILYPPNLPLPKKPDYFLYFQAWTQTVYIADICLSLMTAIEEQGHLLSNFASVMFRRCKSWTFLLDLLATIWIEDIVVLLGKPELYSICQFNRLIKVYVVYFKNNTITDVRRDPGLIFYLAPFLQFSSIYVSGYFVIALTEIEPQLGIRCFFGPIICGTDSHKEGCELLPSKMHWAAITWFFRSLFVKAWPDTLEELFVKLSVDYTCLIIAVFCAGRMLTVIYYKNKNTADYLFFSLNLRHRFKQHNVHPGIWNRLRKYLICYWKYNRDLEIDDVSLLKHEPYDIYWKAHGEIAAELITMCKAFNGANPALTKELAHIAKFTILPKNSTILLTGVTVKEVCWLVNGVIRKECHTETGLVTEQIYGPDERLVSCSVFFGKPSLITCTSLTECEMLCISTIDFFRVISRYPMERMHIRSCTESFKVSFNDLAKVHLATRSTDQWNEIRKHRKLKEKILTQAAETHMSAWRHPGSKFMQFWSAIRVVLVAADIISASLQGGSFHDNRRVLIIINGICEFSILYDMFVKCCLPYYDSRGILIYSKLKCIVRYLTRGFLLDVIAIAPLQLLPEISPVPIPRDIALLINSISKFARVHLFLGYFDYLADYPLAPVTVLMLIKWQLFTLLVFYQASHYLIIECVIIEWNENFDVTSLTKRAGCWLPQFVPFDETPTPNQMNYLIGESFNLAQCALLGISYGVFNVGESDVILGVCLSILTLVNWFVFGYSLAMLTLSRRGSALFQHVFRSLDKFLLAERLDDELIFPGTRCVFCYSLAMLTLSRRGSALFQHAFRSLDKFLHAERLDDELINRSLAHFSYWWTRTNGVNIYDNFIHKRISSMFRQDILYFFYKQDNPPETLKNCPPVTFETAIQKKLLRTFAGLDMLLNGGDQMMKALSCVGLQFYLLPNVPVMREMDLNPWVFIVHRGEVAITQEGKTLALLKKGSIFGQLQGTDHRPVRVSAHTTQYTDIIRIPVGAFQENIDDKVRYNIRRNPEAAFDYMQVQDPPKENPYNTVKYLLGGGKILRIPWMKNPIKAHLHRGYNCWLCLVWLIGPTTTAFVVLLLPTLPLDIIYRLLVVLGFLDLLNLAHFVSEFYTIELVIIDDVCTYRQVRLRKLREWKTYLDITSIVLPLVTIFTNNWWYQLARLLRLRFFYDFHKYFCQDFKSQKYHSLIDFAVIGLIVHLMVCGWIVVACRPSVLTNTYYIPKSVSTTYLYKKHYNEWVDPEARGEASVLTNTYYIPKSVSTTYLYKKHYNEWVDPEARGEGCKTIVLASNNTTHSNHSFLVPLRWQDDYAMAMGFILSLFTRTNSGNYAAITREEMYYKCFVGYVCNIIGFWVSSSAIRAMYLRYRELLNFDFNTNNLFNYLKHNGLHHALLERVKEYTVLLWQRQKGNWMPELVLEAPLCLREDLYVALYSYHLQDIPLFRAQPAYFTRQLATRLHRIVICPGRELIQEGDIFACIYFIHDGEVEKWYTEPSGEKKMLSLLTTNGFFGVIPGLFPDTPVQFTFITRTVVDIVLLRNRDWQDLLEGYPDIKRDLYEAAKHLKKDLSKT